MRKRYAPGVLIVVIVFLSESCSKDYLLDLGVESIPEAGTWLVNEAYIFWGCPGQDCIPNLTNPKVVDAESEHLSYLGDAELVVGVKKGGKYYAFPHSILDWHEVVNMDDYTISYCPLTGSAIHILDDAGFGVSGLLYNSNLIMYDKESNSFWPQMFLMSASGKQRGTKLEIERMIETTWGTWRKLFPETVALSSQTGYARNYNAYPYGSYRTDGSVVFPVERWDDRLHPKERILGIVAGGAAKAYTIADFDTLTALHDEIGGEKFVIFGSSEANFAVAYRSDRQFTPKEFDVENGTVLLRDVATGTDWNIFGEAVSGPDRGKSLEYGASFISFWFAWAAFYPETGVWEGGD